MIQEDSINLLEELDNISRIHILERSDIDNLMIEFAKRILVTLRIERLSVWLFNPERDAIVSMGEYDLRTHEFKKQSILYASKYPSYFKALEQNKILLAENIQTNPHTQEFTRDYSIPNDIISLMDIPLRIEGKLVGVMCFEKTGNKERIFTEKEQTFAFSISLVFASNLEARQRRALQHKLTEALEEKELLIKEINHRVKNNFSILISLLRLSKQKGKTNDPVFILEEYEQRILSMLKIHDLLYITKNYYEVALSDYLYMLVNEFKSTHPDISKKINFSSDCEDCKMESKSAMHIGLIVTEIFLNSIKHSNPSESVFRFSIRLKRLPNDDIQLTVGDNGKGFEFDKWIKHESLGLPLIKDLAEGLELTSKYPDGTNSLYEFILKG